MLLQRIVTAQEDERARIARDLHDHLGQQLTALRLSLQRHNERLESGDGDREQVVHALAIAEKIDNDLDFLAWELRPAALDDHGLGDRAADLRARVVAALQHPGRVPRRQAGRG